MKQNLILILVILTFHISSVNGQSQDYEIKIKLENYSEAELTLAYYLGNSKYIFQTVQLDQNGFFTFSKQEPIKAGLYLVVMKPNNDFFDILVTNEEKKFTVYANAKKPIESIRFENAPDNTLFYEYLEQINKKQVQLANVESKKKSADDEMKIKLQEELEQLEKEVLDYQKKFIKKNPNLFSSKIIKATLPVDIPTFNGTKDEIGKYKREYYKKHFFDNISLSDERMLRTPFLFQAVNSFVNNFVDQQPDSIIKSIDYVLDKMKPAQENFKFFLIHFFNQYAKSNIVGMDAVYVHLGLNYYDKGLAPWTDEKELNKIIENAKTLEPLLIGKKAPNLNLQNQGGKPIELYQIDSKYIILYFFRDDDEDHSKYLNQLNFIQEKYSNRGVKIVAICSKLADEVNDCWAYIEKNETKNWLILSDPYHRSRFKVLYNIKSTPQIYVLDSDKIIISKKIDARQVEEVLEGIFDK